MSEDIRISIPDLKKKVLKIKSKAVLEPTHGKKGVNDTVNITIKTIHIHNSQDHKKVIEKLRWLIYLLVFLIAFSIGSTIMIAT